jgi:raffinose/stachyose/melibiose transport system permease protein
MNRYTFRTATLEVVMILAALIIIFPAYILVNIAFKPTGTGASPLAPGWPPTLDNFIQAWTQADLGRALLNSVVVTVLSVVFIVIVSALAAYPLARSTAKWSTGAFYTFMIGLLLPFQLALIPLYETMRDLGLLGTHASLIIFYIGVQVPFSIFLYTGFLRQIPVDFEEAARIDGCGPLRSFFHVVLPMLRPITGTVVILNGIFVWNDFLTPLLYLSGTDQQTLPVAIYTFVGEFVSQWNLIFAGLIVGAVPVLLCVAFIQRSFVRGYAGGLKG